MSSCICIDSHEKIILVFTNFYNWIKISTLEVALKGKFSTLFDGWVHTFENSGMFGLKVGVKFSKISSHVLIIRSHRAFVLKRITSLHFLVHFKATLKPGTYLRREIPRKITLSLYLDPKEVSSSITSSLILASKLKGIGPIILFLGLHPITISGSSEWCLWLWSTAGKCDWTEYFKLYNLFGCCYYPIPSSQTYLQLL